MKVKHRAALFKMATRHKLILGLIAAMIIAAIIDKLIFPITVIICLAIAAKVYFKNQTR
jgi:hypothetical protein